MNLRSQPSFDRLVPVSDRYASLPVDQAFTWADCLDDVEPGEWYMVAFRSVRRPDIDEARLTVFDDLAHAEATAAPGFVHYFKGPTTPGGGCMSFCLWNSRAEARAAAGRPAHSAAAAVTHESYATYTLEFHRVRRLAGDGGFSFEPWDDRPSTEERAAPKPLTARKRAAAPKREPASRPSPVPPLEPRPALS